MVGAGEHQRRPSVLTMPTWTVRTRDELDEGVTAADLTVTGGGALVFYNGGDEWDRQVLIAYAPHTWNSVHRDED